MILCLCARALKFRFCRYSALRPNAKWPFALSSQHLYAGGWNRVQNGKPSRAMKFRQNLNIFVFKSVTCPLLPVRPFSLLFLLTVLMPSRRNGWSESASRGRHYPVSFLIGLRFYLAVTMLFVYSELHWHKTAEVRVWLGLD